MVDPITVTDHDLDIMARTLWGECRGEIKSGQIAVAWVIRTRAQWQPPAWWGAGIAGVCQRHSDSGIYQFSCWDAGPGSERDRLDALTPGDANYQWLYAIGKRVCAGLEPNPVEGATHYKRIGTPASWADIAPVATIGNHEFYALGPGA